MKSLNVAIVDGCHTVTRRPKLFATICLTAVLVAASAGHPNVKLALFGEVCIFVGVMLANFGPSFWVKFRFIVAVKRSHRPLERRGNRPQLLTRLVKKARARLNQRGNHQRYGLFTRLADHQRKRKLMPGNNSSTCTSCCHGVTLDGYCNKCNEDRYLLANTKIEH